MATSSEEGHLTNKQIVLLSTAISSVKMKSIALGYLGLTFENLASLVKSWREDHEAFNREIIYNWMCRNSGSDQTKKLAGILYKAASEGGYVDPDKVQEILELSREEAMIPEISSGQYEPPLEDEMETVATPLREHYKKTMKIEMAPWTKGCTVDMKDMYTELVLANKPTGPDIVGIEHYSELFKDNTHHEQQTSSKKIEPSKIPVPIRDGKGSTIRRSVRKSKVTRVEKKQKKTGLKHRRCPGKRILFKGEPGMGKTTLSRKITWDWAMGKFTNFAIIFLISLKIIRPGEIIENVIIHQTPVLSGTNIPVKKLQKFLENFGENCLLILDGYDECSVRTKTEIDRIIKAHKLFYCNVILTSRPHITIDVEPSFETVVWLFGFSRSHAQSFARKHLLDKKKRKIALQFASGHIYTCPMILLFTCILMQNDELNDVKGGKMPPGEVYFRLMRCIFRKYATRKGVKFSSAHFTESLRRVGKIALETLLSGRYSYQRSDIEKELGEDAFEYGYVIGHEDHRLLFDETADIFVSFPHTSNQDFLGALGFLLNLGNGEEIENIREMEFQTPICLFRPLFLQFCLWFLKSGQASSRILTICTNVC